MTKIVHKNLPNAISVSDVTDATVRQKLMLANQNIATLMAQLSEAQKAIIELQRKEAVVSVSGGSVADVKVVVGATLQERNIQDGAEPNVQSDWNQTDEGADDYIKNKPTIPGPISQVNSDWNATSGVAEILNKPTSMVNPNSLKLFPIDASGEVGSKIQYNGSETKSINVVTEHQDISTKITYPSGGNNDNVLMKNGTGAKWGSIPVIYTKSFTETSAQMTATSNVTLTKNVAVTGYTPVLVGNVACSGNSTISSESFKNCICVACSIEGSNVILKIGLAAPPSALTQTATVTFTVLYTKN